MVIVLHLRIFHVCLKVGILQCTAHAKSWGIASQATWPTWANGARAWLQRLPFIGPCYPSLSCLAMTALHENSGVLSGPFDGANLCKSTNAQWQRMLLLYRVIFDPMPNLPASFKKHPATKSLHTLWRSFQFQSVGLGKAATRWQMKWFDCEGSSASFVTDNFHLPRLDLRLPLPCFPLMRLECFIFQRKKWKGPEATPQGRPHPEAETHRSLKFLPNNRTTDQLLLEHHHLFLVFFFVYLAGLGRPSFLRSHILTHATRNLDREWFYHVLPSSMSAVDLLSRDFPQGWFKCFSWRQAAAAAMAVKSRMGAPCTCALRLGWTCWCFVATDYSSPLRSCYPRRKTPWECWFIITHNWCLYKL